MRKPNFLHVRRSFLTGLVILLPIGVTVWLITFLLTRVGNVVRPWLVELLNHFVTLPKESVVIVIFLNIISLFIVAAFIIIIGWVSRFFVGRYFINLTERMVNALPFINSIYRTVKQIVDTFSQQQKAIFQKCVLVEYPRKGVWALGFLTSDAKGEVQHNTGQHLLNVFVPTTPNPTSGYLLMVPEDEVKDLQMSISDGMKLIISGGAVVPPFKQAEIGDVSDGPNHTEEPIKDTPAKST